LSNYIEIEDAKSCGNSDPKRKEALILKFVPLNCSLLPDLDESKSVSEIP